METQSETLQPTCKQERSLALLGWDWTNSALRDRRVEREEEPSPPDHEQILEEAAILATREPYGLALVRINPTKAYIGPYVVRRRRAGGPWFLRFRRRILTSESVEVLFYRLVKVLDQDPIVTKEGITHDAVLPAQRKNRADCDDPELESYEWNRSRCRYWEHSLTQ